MGPEIIKEDSSDNEELKSEVDKDEKGSTVGDRILETINEHETIIKQESSCETPSRPTSASSNKKSRKRKARDYDWNTSMKKKKRKSTAR